MNLFVLVMYCASAFIRFVCSITSLRAIFGAPIDLIKEFLWSGSFRQEGAGEKGNLYRQTRTVHTCRKFMKPWVWRDEETKVCHCFLFYFQQVICFVHKAAMSVKLTCYFPAEKPLFMVVELGSSAWVVELLKKISTRVVGKTL